MNLSLNKWLLLLLAMLIVASAGYAALHANGEQQGMDAGTTWHEVKPPPDLGVVSSNPSSVHLGTGGQTEERHAAHPENDNLAAGALGRDDHLPHTERILSGFGRNRKLTLDWAIEEALTKYGPKDPRVAQVVNDAAAMCSGVLDPYDSTNPAAPDDSRTWAVERALDLCRGFDKSKYHLEPPPVSDAGQIKSLLGKDAAVQQAFKDIATSHRLHSLAQAGALLFETDEFPYARVLPRAELQYGLPDLNLAWILASKLVLCREQGPCGPGSLQVANFCRKKGCPPGSDLVSAYRRDVPAYIFTAIIAFTSWMESLRIPYR